MDENRPIDANKETVFSRQVGEQVARKLKAKRDTTRGIWFGLGMSGLIGWSVTVPTLIGADQLGIHRPAFSFGIQKKIYRHAFTFGVTNSPGTTVSQRAGTDAKFPPEIRRE